jgi:hypothetical protein
VFKERNSRQKMTQVGYYGSGRIFEGSAEEEDSIGDDSHSDYELDSEEDDVERYDKKEKE